MKTLTIFPIFPGQINNLNDHFMLRIKDTSNNQREKNNGLFNGRKPNMLQRFCLATIMAAGMKLWTIPLLSEFPKMHFQSPSTISHF